MILSIYFFCVGTHSTLHSLSSLGDRKDLCHVPTETRLTFNIFYGLTNYHHPAGVFGALTICSHGYALLMII